MKEDYLKDDDIHIDNDSNQIRLAINQVSQE